LRFRRKGHRSQLRAAKGGGKSVSTPYVAKEREAKEKQRRKGRAKKSREEAFQGGIGDHFAGCVKCRDRQGRHSAGEKSMWRHVTSPFRWQRRVIGCIGVGEDRIKNCTRKRRAGIGLSASAILTQ